MLTITFIATMKKIFTLSVCLSSVLFSFGQIKYGFFAGPQKTVARYLVADEQQETSWKNGLQGGVMLKVPFENQLYFTPAIYYSAKGYRVSLKNPAFPPGEEAVGNDVRVHAIEIAPLLNIDFSKNENHMFIRFGPSIDVAVGGREHIFMSDGKEVEQSMKFANTAYGRFTSAANVQLGYEFKSGFFMYAHYAQGLGSMNNSDYGPIIRHRLFGVSLGAFFWKNPNVIDTRVIDK
jgi:hypothetical protein